MDYFPALLARLRSGAGVDEAAELERAAREHPRDARPLLLLAAARVEADDVDGAEGYYLMALNRAPDFAIARFQLGLLQLTSGRPAAALATWVPLGRLDSRDPLRLFKEGLEALVQNRFDEAHSLIAEGMAQNTTNPPLNRDMQKLLDRMIQYGGRAPSADAPADGGDAAPRASEGHFLVSTYRSGR